MRHPLRLIILFAFQTQIKKHFNIDKQDIEFKLAIITHMAVSLENYWIKLNSN